MRPAASVKPTPSDISPPAETQALLGVFDRVLQEVDSFGRRARGRPVSQYFYPFALNTCQYRESYPGGGRDDPTDAKYQARMLRERLTTLTAWQPDDENTGVKNEMKEMKRPSSLRFG